MNEFRRILKKNGKAATVLCLLLMAASLLWVITGYHLGGILDSVQAEGNKLLALFRSFMVPLLLALASIGMDYIASVEGDRVQRVVKTDLRRLAAEKVASLPYNEFSQKDSGAYVSWLSNDIELLYIQSYTPLFDAVGNLFRAIFSLTAMCMLSWIVGLAAVILFVIMYVVPQLFNKALQKAMERRSKALESSVEAYRDTIMGVPIFLLSNLQEQITGRIVQASQQAEAEIFISNRTQRRASSTVSGVNLTNQLLLFAVTALAVILGTAPMGAILSVGNLCGTFFNGVSGLVKSVMSIRSAKPLWEKFQQQEQASVEKKELAPVRKISMENLSFRYGDRVILDNKDLCFEAGGKYAILGESGSGKTTVLKLLMGLLPGYEGRICYDGCEQKQADLSSLYDQVAYVDQQVYLFQDTLRYNITLGQPYTDEEIMEAVKACKLEGLVEALPNGLDSIIAENGKNLSGGQRQRIALARGFIRKVHYMILDEGTSALDEENAVDIEQNLMEQDNLGVIIITHHLHDCVRKQLTEIYCL